MIWIALVLYSLTLGHALIEPSANFTPDYQVGMSGHVRVRREMWLRTSPWYSAEINPKRDETRITLIAVPRGIPEGITIIRQEGRVVCAFWGAGTCSVTVPLGEHHFEATAADGTVGTAGIVVRHRNWAENL